MIYKNVKEGVFLSRPNRFIANVEIEGRVEICHVKNTGRCKELLIPGVRAYVCKSENPNRKTAYDLIGVYKGKKLFNIDSNAPNKVFYEWLCKFDEIAFIKPECRFGNSRFDFYIETKDKKVFIEVKGVTLEKNGVMTFPDAPTVRGVKHINELISCVETGYEGVIAFVVQTDFGEYFTPNRDTHPEFADALKRAAEKGVKIICFTCDVTPDALSIKDELEIKLL